MGADDIPTPIMSIPKVEQAPTLDDFIEGVAREAEMEVTDFRQFQPGDGVPVSRPTTAYLSYDDENIYVGFICKDEPELIRARVAKREQIMQDDRISICLDTFHDHRHMYWFDVNPYGVQADGNVTDGVEDDPSWDTLWYSDAKLTEDGYVLLATIPFKSLRFPSDEEQTWGLILGRWIMRDREFSLWPHVSKGKPGFVAQGGDMAGIRNISPGRNIQIIPYGMFGRSRYFDLWPERTGPDAVPQYRTETEINAGVDVKMVLKDALTLDITVNPDFSQVESDEPQVTVNQRYEVYFPEKRPFFMENAGYFKTPEQLFFSRRIVDPQFGARMTGKVGKWALGALMTDDQAPGQRVEPENELFGRRSVVGVARLQRDIGQNSTVAGMVTSQDFGSTFNRVYSADMRLQLLRNWVLTGQAMSSDTRTMEGERLKGPAYSLNWKHDGRHFMSETSYRDRSPNFRSALGYFDRVDIREVGQEFGYLWRPEGGVIQAFGPIVEGTAAYNREGVKRDWSVRPLFYMGLTRMTRIIASYLEAYELYDGIGFRGHQGRVSLSGEPTKWLGLEAAYGAGKDVNYYPREGLKPFLGDMRRASAGFTLRPDARLRIRWPGLPRERRYSTITLCDRR
jgi:uncharacterized protein DUF5916/cellulose/xylan binding protein with CBM9 domain